MYAVYERLSKVGSIFSIAVAFGRCTNRERLGGHQAYAKKTIRLRQRQTHFFAHARSMNIDTDTHTSCFRSCLTIKTDDHHLFVGDWYRYRFSRLKHCYNRMYSMVQCIFGLFFFLKTVGGDTDQSVRTYDDT